MTQLDHTHLAIHEIHTLSFTHSKDREYAKTKSISVQILRLFCSTGATRCTDGVKFGMEEWTEDSKFHPHRCKDKGIFIGPQNCKFY